MANEKFRWTSSEYHLRDHLGNLRVAFRAELLQEQQELRMENPASEEGPYPAFENVASTQSTDYAYEGQYSAAVSAGNRGPATTIPVVSGYDVKVDLFYLTPAGVQSYRTAAPAGAGARGAVAVGLAPVLLPAPMVRQTEAGASAQPDGPAQPAVSPGARARTHGAAGPQRPRPHAPVLRRLRGLDALRRRQ